ncbi:hypothetical protein [Streptomyces sp. NL15-2K]|uniref:hypothetical protein n=1 Tax=Streptomyces sp. NL15-2K TaxID=376149 RepID=UPI000F584997|nr:MULTISPECIES: hypothetical protein [Actinomycetes]WKX13579.1 hypothetical protein Q4V64_41050 [Kutzneria buriramensis]GCB45027.1 hypothetical protein SNL152K_2317 [Streptomyces sp. NL15-2K]
MTKLKPAQARAITADWAGLFPQFTVWQPLRLLRRIGPVLQGITLERTTSSEEYRPTAHVHALTQDFPVITLSLAHHLHPVSAARDTIEVDRHAEEFRAAAARLEERSTLPLHRWPTLAEVVQAYRDYAVAQQRGRLPAGIREFEDSVLIPAAAGDGRLAEESLHLVEEAAGRWSSYEAPIGWSDTNEWLNRLRSGLRDPAGLAATVEQQIDKHNLTKVRTE